MTEKEKRDRGFLYNANYDEEILNELTVSRKVLVE